MEVKLKFTIIQALVILVYGFLTFESAYTQDLSAKKKILMLYGSIEITQWQRNFGVSFYDELTGSQNPKVSITNEHLASDYLSGDVEPETILAYLRDKIAASPVDLVVGVLPGANKFLTNYGHLLFPEIPKIHLLPGQVDKENSKALSRSIIIKSSSSVALDNNVERIFSILPNTKQLYIICGSGYLDQFFLSLVKNSVRRLENSINVTYWVGVPYDELMERVAKIPKHSAIIFTTFAEDIKKRKYASLDFFPQLSDKANAPVFGFLDTLMGKGILGGNLTSAKLYGQKTAQISLEILSGKPLSSFPSISGISKDFYDWRQLKRWRISEDHLPPGSQVLYKTETFWEENITEIILTVSIISLQTLLIIALVSALKRRRTTEKQLIKSESTARALLNMPMATVILLDQNGRVLDANEIAIQLFSTSRASFLGSSVWDFIPDQLAESRKKKVDQVIKKGKLIRFEDERDGKWLDNILNPILDEQGNVTRIAVIAQDISLRKQAEIELLNYRDHLEDLIEIRTAKLAKTNLELQQEIEERQKIEKALKKTLIALEDSNRELDDFAYIASHDLKEPLRGINNFSTFLIEDYGNILDKEGVRKLETLVTLTNRLKTLIDDLLTFSRMGRTELSIQETDMNVILLEVLETLSILMEEKRVEIKVPNPLPTVYCDNIRIKEVFRNLISNALKYNDKENPWIKIGYFDNKFYISDNGIGIKEKHFDDIFRIFKRLHARNKYGGGTGSGMTIIKKIIEKHQGKIWLESKLGQGTTFYFTLGGHIDE